MDYDDKLSGKTALVLAGGGLTGAVYHIGALRAIDDLLVDRSVNDFDIYVGTSAGSIIAALLASCFSPSLLMQTIVGSTSSFDPIDRGHIFSIRTQDLFHWGLRLPQKTKDLFLKYARNFRGMTLFDALWGLSEFLPQGLYSTSGLEHYLRQLLKEHGRGDCFEDLERELYVIATDLNSGARVVFGNGERDETPISKAVAASSALPLFYRPVEIDGCQYVDGGMRGNASVDLAIERGAKLVVVINPLVPFQSDDDDRVGAEVSGSAIRAKGMRSVADQVLRIISHSNLQYHIKQLRRRHPEVDIILIEPHANDYKMFHNNIMEYSARLEVARHGFESVTLDLAEDFPYYKQVLARHGIPISRRLVIDELAEIYKSGYDPEVVREVLAARSAPCTYKKRDWPTCRLTRTLAELDLVLDRLGD